MEKYDLAVLGGGPGGYVAAIRAAQLGLKTAIIDRDRLGGVCLNWGCIPTKALLKNAEVLHLVKNAKKYGIEIPDYSVRFDRTVKRSRQVAERLSKGVEYLMKKNRITHIIGTGVLRSATELMIKDNDAVDRVIADKIIIATGGRPRTFPGLELDGKQVISAKEAMVLKEPPERLVIIGAGAIGVEFAYFYNEFGSQVHLIEMLPQILPLEDEEVSKTLTRSFIKSGIKIHTGTRVQRIEKLTTAIKVHTASGDETKIIDGDLALVAVGITGNIENIGLEAVGVKTAEGSIVINDHCRTNIPNIYAIGDVSGPPWLAHVASAQGHVAAEHAAGHTPRPVDYANI
ncbi:MAG: FAD-dependent oxidoreductase, partial [FCB group bacterium]|nr:FAD-dependent oxidoreductase [FCB group bacterium]